MTIRKTKTVDWLGIEKDTGAILLTVVDDENWTNEREHVELPVHGTAAPRFATLGPVHEGGVELAERPLSVLLAVCLPDRTNE